MYYLLSHRHPHPHPVILIILSCHRLIFSYWAHRLQLSLASVRPNLSIILVIRTSPSDIVNRHTPHSPSVGPVVPGTVEDLARQLSLDFLAPSEVN